MIQWWSIEKFATKIIPDYNGKIIFVWYQWKWTRWREIIDWKEYVTIDGKNIPIKCSFTIINGFSSHPDTDDIISIISKIKKNLYCRYKNLKNQKRKEKIKLVLTHWWDNRYYMEKLISTNAKLRKKYNIHVAKIKEKITIKL